ncbi:MAG TPA: ribonuclease HII [Nakamurella multipartita]|nr:ribonuclease HII [Nakamurella multipartita]
MVTVRRPHLRVEKQLMRDGVTRLAAMDEVGRGALAGPVSVGVVVVTPEVRRVPPGLADSKLLTPQARHQLVAPVRRWVQEYAVGHASADEIDAIGIIAALRTAGRRALAELSGPVDAILLDGNHNYLREPAAPVAAPDPLAAPLFEVAAEAVAPVDPTPAVHVRIKADMTCAAVAGASVLAKTERDAILTGLGPDYPVYGFAVNKGYGTPEHLAALREHGPCAVHRRSWRLPCGEQVAEGMMFS